MTLRRLKPVQMLHLIVGALLSLAMLQAAPTQSSTGTDASSAQMLQLVNSVRISNNVRPLCYSEKLVQAANAHSSYQASTNTMTHDGPVSLGDRFIRQGYQPAAVAENVGFTSTPFVQVVFDIWMSSPEHRTNILDPTYTHFGSANSIGSNGMYYWTQLFASPMNPALEPCDFNAAATAVTLNPQSGSASVSGFSGMYNYNSNSSGINSNPASGPSAQCSLMDLGSVSGKSLACRVTPSGPAGVGGIGGVNGVNGINGVNGPAGVNGVGVPGSVAYGPNPALGPLGPNQIAAPGYPGTNCAVVSTSPAPDGQGSVRVFSCSSGPATNPSGTGYSNPPGYNPPGIAGGVGYNPPGTNTYASNPPGYNPPGANAYASNPPGYNPPGANIYASNPPGYNPPGANIYASNPPGYNPPGTNSYTENPPGYNPPGTNGYTENPPGYNPPGTNSYASNPPGYNPPGTSGCASNPPGYNPPGANGYTNPPGVNEYQSNPPGATNYGSVSPLWNPPGIAGGPGYNNPATNTGTVLLNPPGYNPPGYSSSGSNPPGYNPPGYNPPGYSPPGYNPPGYNPQANNPPGYNPPGYNPPLAY